MDADGWRACGDDVAQPMLCGIAVEPATDRQSDVEAPQFAATICRSAASVADTSAMRRD